MPAPPARAAAGAASRRGLRLAAAQALQAREDLGAAAVAARRRVEHDAPAEGVGRGDRAHHDTVAGAGQQRPFQARLPEAVAELGQPRGRLARAVVHVRAHPVAGAAQRQLAVDHARLRQRARRREHVAARDVADRDAGQVERNALAGLRALDGLVVDLHGAHPHLRAGRQQREPVARRDRA